MTQTEPRPTSEPSQASNGLDAEQVGYKQTLTRRHVQMIAIGGAIGTGLFLGSASRLHSTGPALLLSYAFVGVIAYLLMRALGELVLHRATSGAFVSYMREFYGEKAAYVTGWMYWLNWALTGIAELSAVGLYVQYWADSTGCRNTSHWRCSVVRRQQSSDRAIRPKLRSPGHPKFPASRRGRVLGADRHGPAARGGCRGYRRGAGCRRTVVPQRWRDATPGPEVPAFGPVSVVL